MLCSSQVAEQKTCVILLLKKRLRQGVGIAQWQSCMLSVHEGLGSSSRTSIKKEEMNEKCSDSTDNFLKH